jgi:hypothetical protein
MRGQDPSAEQTTLIQFLNRKTYFQKATLIVAFDSPPGSIVFFLSMWQEEALPLLAGGDMNAGYLKYGTLSPESFAVLNSCHFVRFLSAFEQYHGELKK